MGQHDSVQDSSCYPNTIGLAWNVTRYWFLWIHIPGIALAKFASRGLSTYNSPDVIHDGIANRDGRSRDHGSLRAGTQYALRTVLHSPVRLNAGGLRHDQRPRLLPFFPKRVVYHRHYGYNYIRYIHCGMSRSVWYPGYVL